MKSMSSAFVLCMSFIAFAQEVQGVYAQEIQEDNQESPVADGPESAQKKVIPKRLSDCRKDRPNVVSLKRRRPSPNLAEVQAELVSQREVFRRKKDAELISAAASNYEPDIPPYREDLNIVLAIAEQVKNEPPARKKLFPGCQQTPVSGRAKRSSKPVISTQETSGPSIHLSTGSSGYLKFAALTCFGIICYLVTRKIYRSRVNALES